MSFTIIGPYYNQHHPNIHMYTFRNSPWRYMQSQRVHPRGRHSRMRDNRKSSLKQPPAGLAERLRCAPVTRSRQICSSANKTPRATNDVCGGVHCGFRIYIYSFARGCDETDWYSAIVQPSHTHAPTRIIKHNHTIRRGISHVWPRCG